MRKEYTFDNSTTFNSDSFPMVATRPITIHHAAIDTLATGTWTLEIYNQANDSWETVTAASSAFTNPSSSTVGGVAAFIDPPTGTGRVTYTASSGGADGDGVLIIETSVAGR